MVRGLVVYVSSGMPGLLLCLIGSVNGTDFTDTHMLYGNNASLQFWNPAQAPLTVAVANWTGFWSGQRTATNAASIYLANSVTPHFAAVTDSNNRVHVANSLPMFAWARKTNGTSDLWTNFRISFVAATQGLTQTEDLALYNAVQALRTAFGGGFV